MLSSDAELETFIKKVISIYNLTHSPNATAKLIQLIPPILVIQFSGVFCTGCGTLGITEAFADQYRILSRAKTHIEQKKTMEINPHTFQTTFIIKDQ